MNQLLYNPKSKYVLVQRIRMPDSLQCHHWFGHALEYIIVLDRSRYRWTAREHEHTLGKACLHAAAEVIEVDDSSRRQTD